MTKTRKVSRKTSKERIINFAGKSWLYIQEAYMKLKGRYKMKVSLSRLRPQGADLFTGYFSVA